MYEDAFKTSTDSLGALQGQQDIYMEDTEAHLNKMRASMDNFYDSMLDSSTINAFASLTGGTFELLANVIDGVGGGSNIALMAASQIARIYNGEIAIGLTKFVDKLRNGSESMQNIIAQQKMLKNFQDIGVDSQEESNNLILRIADIYDKILKNKKLLTDEEIEYANVVAKDIIEQERKLSLYKEQLEIRQKLISLMGMDDPVFTDADKSERIMTNYVDGNLKSKEEFIGKDGYLGDIRQNIQASTTDPNNAANLVASKGLVSSMGHFLHAESSEGEDLNQTLKRLMKTYAVLEKDTKKVDEVKKRLEATMQGLNTQFERMENQETVNKGNLDKNLNSVYDIMTMLVGVARDAAVETSDLFAQAPEANRMTDAIKKGEQALNGFLNKTISIRKAMKGLVDGVSAVGTIASGAMSLSNLGDIWSDTNLTEGEKLLQTITSLGFALPSVFMGLNMLKDAMIESGLAQKMFNTELFKTTFAETHAVLTTKALDKATEDLNASQVAGAATATGQAVAISGLKKATIGARAGMRGLTAAITASPVGVITAIMAAVAGVALAFDALHLSSEEAAEAIAEANQQFKESESELKSLQDELKSIQDTISSIDPVQITEDGQLTILRAQEESLKQQVAYAERMAFLDKKEYVQEVVDKGQTETGFTESPDEKRERLAAESGITYEAYGELAKNRMIDERTAEQKENLLMEGKVLFSPANEEEIRRVAEIQAEMYQNVLDGVLSGEDLVTASKEYLDENKDKVAKKREYKAMLENLSSSELEEFGGQEAIDEEIAEYEKEIAEYDKLFSETYPELIVEQSATEQIEAANQAFSLLLESVDKLRNGTSLTIEEISKLASAYSEFANVAEGTNYEQLQVLSKIRDKANNEDLLGYKDRRSEIISANTLQSDVREGIVAPTIIDRDELQRQLDDLNFEINVQARIETDQDISDAFAIGDEIEKINSYLEEGLSITSDQAQKMWEDGYGAMLENAQIAADGSMQLNQETVDAYVKGRETELQATVDAKKKELQLERDALVAKRDILREQKAELEKVLTSDTKDEAAEAMANAAGKQLEYEKTVQEQSNNIIAAAKEDEASMELQMAKDIFGTREILATDSIGLTKSIAEADYEQTNAELDNLQKKIDAWNEYHKAKAEGNGGDIDTDAVEATVEAGIDESNLGDSPTFTAEDLAKDSILKSTELDVDALKIIAQEALNAISVTENGISNDIGAIDAALLGMEATFGDLGGAAEDLAEMLEDELDIYHDINIAIGKTERAYSDLEKAQDKLFGQDLLDNLAEQRVALSAQTELLKEKMSIMDGDLARQRESLANLGVQFSTTGDILGYNELLAVKLLEVNAAIAGGAANADDLKASYESLNAGMEKYETTLYSDMEGLKDELDDVVDRQYEIFMEQFTMKIELRLDLGDLRREWNDFMKEMSDINDDDVTGSVQHAFDNLQTYFKGDGDVASLMEQLNKTAKDTTLSEADRVELMQEYNSELMNALTAAKELEKLIEEGWVNAMEQASEAFGEYVEQYEYLNELIEHNLTLVELLYGETAYDMYADIYDSQYRNNLAQLDFLKQQKDYWTEIREDFAEGTDEWDKANKNLEETQSSLNSLITESMQTLATDFTNTVDKTFHDLEMSLTGNLGMFGVQEEWDQLNYLSEKYYDNITGIYEIQKLTDKINETLLDKENLTVKAQERLEKLRDEELKFLREKDKLTKQEVERANLLYALTLKQIALDEAQEAKDQLKLVRNSQGNYDYMFTPDTEKVAAAEEGVMGAQNDLYQFDVDSYRNNLNEVQSLYMEWETKIKEIYSNVNYTEEQRELMKVQYAQYYGQLINDVVAENEYLKQNLYQSSSDLSNMLWEQDSQNFINTQTMLAEFFNNSVQSMIDKFATGEESFGVLSQQVYSNLNAATQEYMDKIVELEEMSGENFTNVGDAIADVSDKTNELLEGNNVLIESFQKEWEELQILMEEYEKMKEHYDIMTEKAIALAEAMKNDLAEAMKNAADASTKSSEVIVDNINDMIKAFNEMKRAADAAYTAAKAAKAAQDAVNTEGSSSSSSNGFGLTNLGLMLAKGNNVMGANKGGIVTAARGTLVNGGSLLDGIARGLGEDTMIAAKSGERVLSVQQTEAFDRFVYDLMPKLNSALTLLTPDISGRTSYLNSLSTTTPSSVSNSNADNRQTIINAEFPNVESASEIRQALEELSLRASQRAM